MEFGKEYQVRETKSMKKETKFIIGIVVVALVIGGFLAFRNLTAERKPITVEAFIEVMESNGYEITDVTYEYASADDPYVEIMLTAFSENYQFEFLEFSRAMTAQVIFQDVAMEFETNHGGQSSSQSFINGGNFDTFQLTSDGYFQILRIENVVVIGMGERPYRDHIREIFRLIENRE